MNTCIHVHVHVHVQYAYVTVKVMLHETIFNANF